MKRESGGPTERLTAWVLSWGSRPSAPALLVLFTMIEATVFPAPTEALLLALCVSRPDRSLAFGLLAAAGSVLGGLCGYSLGATVYTEFAEPIAGSLGMGHHLPKVAALYRDNLWLALGASGYTPIPYMMYTMTAGAFDLPLGAFATASFLGRALKYLPIAIVAMLFGPRVHQLLARYARWAGVVVTAVLAVVLVWRFFVR